MQSSFFLTVGILASVFSQSPLQADTSEAARKKLYFQVEGHIGGNGEGGGFGLFLPGDFRLDMTYFENSASFFNYSAEMREYRLELQSFLGNSFYYGLGVTHKRINLTVKDITFTDSDSYYSGEYISSKLQTTGPHLLIGNEWQWNHFFIGAEWIGYSRPLAWSYTNNYSDDVYDSEKTMWDEDTKKIANLPTLILLNLFLGFSF